MKSVFLSQCKNFLIEKYGNEKAINIQSRAYKRFEELCLENASETKEVRVHTRDRIYPAIALFDSLLENGVMRDEAVNFVMDYYAYRWNIMAKQINTFMSLPFVYKFFKKICRMSTEKNFGEKAGFDARFHETSKDEVCFDMMQCPYLNKCRDYGCAELIEAYCKGDDICYSNMHKKIIFKRTKNLADGDDCCRFNFKIIK